MQISVAYKTSIAVQPEWKAMTPISLQSVLTFQENALRKRQGRSILLGFERRNPSHNFTTNIQIYGLQFVTAKLFEICRQRIEKRLAELDPDLCRPWQTRPARQGAVRAENTHR